MTPLRTSRVPASHGRLHQEAPTRPPDPRKGVANRHRRTSTRPERPVSPPSGGRIEKSGMAKHSSVQYSQVADKAGYKPDSVPLKRDRPFIYAINPEPLPPAAELKRAASGSLFDLAPGGVCPAPFVASGAVVSYTTFSPLSRIYIRIEWMDGTVYFLRHFPSPSISQRSLPLLARAPCPVESGLSSPHLHGRNDFRPCRCGATDHRLYPPSLLCLIRGYNTIADRNTCRWSCCPASARHGPPAVATSCGNRRRYCVRPVPTHNRHDA